MKSGITPSLAIFVGLLSLTPVDASAQDSPSYRNQAAPILQKYCGACHNSATSEGGLSLLSAAAIKKGSTDGPVISTEEPAESRLLQVIESTGDDHMPPQDEPQPSPEDIAVLKAWILAGAQFDGAASTRLLVPKLPPAKKSSSPVLSLAARNDGTRIAVGVTGQIQLLPADKFPSIPFDGKITDIRFTPSGQLIVATGVPGLTGRAMLFESETGKFVREYSGHEDLIYAAAISPDGGLVATAVTIAESSSTILRMAVSSANSLDIMGPSLTSRSVPMDHCWQVPVPMPLSRSGMSQLANDLIL